MSLKNSASSSIIIQEYVCYKDILFQIVEKFLIHTYLMK